MGRPAGQVNDARIPAVGGVAPLDPSGPSCRREEPCMSSMTSRTGAGRGWMAAALAAALLAGPAMAQTTSPSAQTIRPNGTSLKPGDPLGPKPPACTFSSISRKTAGPSHDGAELEARVRAMPTTCSQGTFVAAGDV